MRKGILAFGTANTSFKYLRWHAVELSADRCNALFLPRGVAHGFLTFTPGAVVEYLIDTPHVPDGRARWGDPAFAIEWPEAPAVISDRDRT